MRYHRDGSTRVSFPGLLAAIVICGTLGACDGVVAPELTAAAPATATPRTGLITGGYQAGLITGGYHAGLLSGGYQVTEGDGEARRGLLSGGY
jgi:hypothetical protein